MPQRTAHHSERIVAAADALASMASAKDVSLDQWAMGMDMESTRAAAINEPSNPYTNVLWVRRCIEEIGKTCSGIPALLTRGEGLTVRAKSFAPMIAPARHRTLRAVKGSRAVTVGRAADNERVTAGPAADWLARPNTYHTWPQHIAATVGYLYLRGRVAWLHDEMTGRRPGSSHCVDGRRVTPLWHRDRRGIPELIGYEYRPAKSAGVVPLSPDEVSYWALWDDSDDPLGGSSPLTAGRYSIAASHNASLFNAAQLANGCEPGMVITFGRNLGREQRDEFTRRLRQRHQGPGKTKLPLVLEGGGDARPYSTSLPDGAWDWLSRTTRLEICCLLGVPPVVAGWVDAAGDSSAYTSNALRQYYQQTIFPLLDWLAAGVQEILARWDARLVYTWHIEDQPVVQEMRLARVDTAVKLFGLGYGPNQINEMLDLGLPALDWGDRGVLPAGLMPAEMVAAGTMPELAGEGPGSGGDDDLADPDPEPGDEDDSARTAPSSRVARRIAGGLDKAAADAIWQRWYRARRPLDSQAERLLSARYTTQQRLLIRELRRAAPKAAGGERKLQSAQLSRILMEVLSPDGPQGEQWRRRVESIVTDANELGLRQALVEAGVAGDQLDQALRRLMANPAITQRIRSESVRISTRVDSYTRRVLRRQLEAGLEAGEDIRALADRVQDVMGGRRKAAIHTARNAVGQSLSGARDEGQRTAGVTHRIWIHSRGPGERRAAHVAAERHYRANPCPIDQAFVVGGALLRYPRDPQGPPGEVINCQCMTLARRVTRRGADGTAQPVCDAEAVEAIRRAYVAMPIVTYEEMLAAREARASQSSTTPPDTNDED